MTNIKTLACSQRSSMMFLILFRVVSQVYSLYWVQKNETDVSLRKRLKRWAQDAKKHPSPNSGYLEAATAVQLGVELGGRNSYQGVVSHRAIMGEKLVPLTKEHIATSVIHMRIATLLFTLVMLAVEVLIFAIT